jgi:cell division control protein 6
MGLDEFDQLEQKTEIIYDLQMLNEEAANKLGIVMVSNQEPSRIQLDPRSRSRLNCRTLEFEPYDSVQLVEIMQQRAEQAFRAGAVTDNALEVTAERTVEENGDCRRALDLLLNIGREADEEGKSEVTAEMAEEG